MGWRSDEKAHEVVPWYYSGCGCAACDMHRNNPPLALKISLHTAQVEKGFKKRYGKTKEQLKEALGLLQVSSLNGHLAGCKCGAPLCVRRESLLDLLVRL